MYRAALLLLLTLGACAPAVTRGLGVPPQLERVVVDPALLGLLDRVHAEFSDEVAICLVGKVKGRTVYVTRLGATVNHEVSPTSVVYDACLPPFFVGVVHTHPTGECTFSTVDVNTAERSGHLVDLVACGGGRFGWRLKARTGMLAPGDSL